MIKSGLIPQAQKRPELPAVMISDTLHHNSAQANSIAIAGQQQRHRSKRLASDYTAGTAGIRLHST
jgi:uncharacterized protein YeaC (DUF1315 family)